MLKAIIIDDEKLIREGLITYIDWNALGISICATCADGVEGMEAVLEHQPDIILSDISMPNSDGLMLLEQIRAYNINCEIIYISSYSDFRYAQQALKLGAFDYLLKPIEDNVLFECVRRCADSINIKKKKSDIPWGTKADVEKLLYNLLTTLPATEATFISYMSKVLSQSDISSTLLIVSAYCDKERLENVLSYYHGNMREALYIMLSPSISVHFILTGIKFSEEDIIKINNNCIASDLVAVAGSCEQGIYSTYLELQREILYRNLSKEKGYMPKDVIKSLNIDSVHIEIQQLLQDSYADGNISCLMLFIMNCGKMLEKYYEMLEDYYGKPLLNCGQLKNCLEELRKANNIIDVYISLQNILADLFYKIKLQPSMSPYTCDTIKIIEEEYSNNISLKKISMRINVSESHLGKIFKENTTYSFSDYLLRYRMNKAQKLLATNKYKIYEVGSLVGYSDIVQFSKRFKKHFGYSPKQWQKSKP